MLDSVSYDQYSDIPVLSNDSRIIFSEIAYKTLMLLMSDTNKTNAENGCFFVGRQSVNNPHVIYFDYCTSEFRKTDGFFSQGACIPTEKSYDELKKKIEQSQELNVNPCVMHFHTHPTRGYFENFSDQDYSIYAKNAMDNNHCFNFGMLGFPISVDKTAVGFSVVLATNPKIKNGKNCADFYFIQDIYYQCGNSIYKVGSFEKNYSSRKTSSNELDRIDKTIQNCQPGISHARVSGMGKIPNTNLRLEDENVGYIDVDGQIVIETNGFYFPDVSILLNQRSR